MKLKVTRESRADVSQRSTNERTNERFVPRLGLDLSSVWYIGHENERGGERVDIDVVFDARGARERRLGARETGVARHQPGGFTSRGDE